MVVMDGGGGGLTEVEVMFWTEAVMVFLDGRMEDSPKGWWRRISWRCDGGGSVEAEWI